VKQKKRCEIRVARCFLLLCVFFVPSDCFLSSFIVPCAFFNPQPGLAHTGWVLLFVAVWRETIVSSADVMFSRLYVVYTHLQTFFRRLVRLVQCEPHDDVFRGFVFGFVVAASPMF